MPESVYKIVELVGTSSESWEKAATAAIERRRAHQHQRGPVAERGVLQIVEGQRLVEEVEDRPGGMEVADGPRLRRLRRFRIVQFRLVDRRAAQEARAVVSVPSDHLEREARFFAAVLGEHQEEPRGIVEPGPVEPAHAQLLHVGGAEIVPLDSRAHFLDLVREVAGRQPVVGEKAHWNELGTMERIPKPAVR